MFEKGEKVVAIDRPDEGVVTVLRCSHRFAYTTDRSGVSRGHVLHTLRYATEAEIAAAEGNTPYSRGYDAGQREARDALAARLAAQGFFLPGMGGVADSRPGWELGMALADKTIGQKYACEPDSNKRSNGRPSWDDAPAWGQWLAQDENGGWYWWSEKPFKSSLGVWERQIARGRDYAGKGDHNPNWRDTLERRPGQ